VIVRDGKQVFLGSQSLRKLELDERREIGIIFRDTKIAGSLIKCFESDWTGSKSKLENLKPRKAAKKVAKAGLPCSRARIAPFSRGVSAISVSFR
jgi:phosphatidylserine/phosphatidylglycerophosphate/cardiolipin synthase-like enzyme